jgi:hypothetical protein
MLDLQRYRLKTMPVLEKVGFKIKPEGNRSAIKITITTFSA